MCTTAVGELHPTKFWESLEVITRNVFHHRVAHTTACRRISLATSTYLQHNMSPPNNAHFAYHEGAVELALQVFQSGQFRSQKAAANAFNIRPRTLNRRVHGITARRDCIPNSRKLTATEEQTIMQYILELDSRGFAPRLCEVADMADKLPGVRGGEPVGKHWAERFVPRSEKLKMAFNRAKDR
jgi:hypothetical protein